MRACMHKTLVIVLVVPLMLLLMTSVAHAALGSYYNASGLVSLSVDAVGSNSLYGQVTIVKPAGATVKKAYLFVASTPDGYMPAAGDVTIDGFPVSYERVAHHVQVWDGDTYITNNLASEVTNLSLQARSTRHRRVTSRFALPRPQEREKTSTGRSVAVVFGRFRASPCLAPPFSCSGVRIPLAMPSMWLWPIPSTRATLTSPSI